MSHTLGSYGFLPFLRNGLAGLITSADTSGAVALRASLHAELSLAGSGGNDLNPSQTFVQDVQLYGPGDVVGIDGRGIVRMEPRHWSTNVEPNYLAHIEFYDEDFPWRYTPAVAAGDRLRSWITLVVLAEGEFDDGKKPQERPSPFITIKDPANIPALFPPAEQLWAWAHVHANRSLTASDTQVTSAVMSEVLGKLHGYLDEDADLAYSRLICPRKLAADTAYHAFVIPSFESGRLAALGLDHTKAPGATYSAWASYPPGVEKAEGTSFPYYHRWFFRTGGPGDFESLVRLLQAKPVDSRVGTRDMDVRAPGSNVHGIQDDGLNGVLRLGGALKVPEDPELYTAEERAIAQRYEAWDQPYPHAFQTALAKLVNLSDDYATTQAPAANAAALDQALETNVDPLITPPLYGAWLAPTKRLLLNPNGQRVPNDTNWVHKLNLDPRHRVSAGFGARVVQQNQERYMEAAWVQVGAVLEANRQMRLAQLAKHTSLVLYQKHVVPIQRTDAARALMLTAPVLTRVVIDGATLYHRLAQSFVQPALVSGASRRLLRPGGRVRRLMRKQTFGPATLFAQVSHGTISAAPANGVPAGAVTLAKLSAKLPPTARPVALNEAIAIHAGAKRAATLTELTKSSDFRIAPLGGGAAAHVGATDTAEAARFKTAVRDAYALVDASIARASKVVRTIIDVPAVAKQCVAALDPTRTVRARFKRRVKLPGQLTSEVGDDLVEAMAYPVIDDPMYKPLSALSADLFLPNINLIPPNSITLLETNEPFIEAYLVGANHELARELLWREYPTDQRGSCFRQFWDATEALSAAQGDPEQAKESLRDITKIHKWGKASILGAHNNRKPANATAVSKDLVLVIRGELLKRYPTAVIYAHRASWQTTGRLPVIVEDAEENSPPRTKIRTPLYEAKVDPDIYFFGFDLTAKEVKGGTGAQADPGWFFVIKERPGEPRFGLDTDKQQQISVWNDLSWADVQPGAAGSYLQITSDTSTITVKAPDAADQEKTAQHADDTHVIWGPDMSSADLAYILFQAPVLIAIHGAEMLRDK